MKFNLTLETPYPNQELTLNYQYPLSAAIYKILQQASPEFSEFLHNTGYGEGYHQFKFFTFSDIATPFSISGDCMKMKSTIADLQVSFFIPEAAEHFIYGIFMNQQLVIGDKQKKIHFTISQIEKLPDSIIDKKDITEITVEPLSPIVTGLKNDRGYYDYFSPNEEEFIPCLIHNWLQKYKAATTCSEEELEKIKTQTAITISFRSKPPKQRLLTIKADTPEQTKIRGYKNFYLHLHSTSAMLKLALDAGMGLYNSLGCGCVGEGGMN